MAITSTPSRRNRAVSNRDLGALLVIFLFFLVFFHRVVFSGQFLVASDAFNYFYPLRTVVWNELREGRLPLWTPQIMSGYPLLSMAQIGIGYPLTWFYLFLPGHWAEQIYCLTPFLLTPVFTFVYLREVGRTHLASILGALAFGYGGFMVSPLTSYCGLSGNATMWLPLLLTVIERARRRPFVNSMLAATGAYAASVLTGGAQSFVYVAFIALAYALVMGTASKSQANQTGSRNIRAMVDDSGEIQQLFHGWTRWRPLVATLCAIIFAVGIDAFQILETMQAQRLSIRNALTYELFVMGSYKLDTAARSFLLPLHSVFEASAYVTTLVLAMAIIAAIIGARNWRRTWQVFFWSGTAALGFILMLGENTPVAGVLYHIPPFNLFRGAARHAFEFTFATCVLSAYGWDLVSAWASRHAHLSPPLPGTSGHGFSLRDPWWRSLCLGAGFLALALGIGVLWAGDVAKFPVSEMELYYFPTKFPESRYLLWKLSFSFLILCAAWQLFKVHLDRLRVALLLAAIVAACFFEPSIMASRWWWPALKPASRFTAVSQPTALLRSYPSQENRIYTHVYPMVEEHADPPRLDPANLTMLHGLQNIAGYEPLILDRYSRALGDVYIDAVKPRPGYAADPTLFDSRSHVLDLLNTRFLVSYPDLATEPAAPTWKEGIKFSARDLDTTLKPGQTTTLEGVAANADTLALVTSTAFSANEPDGAEVAKVRVFPPAGKMVENSLRIGIDTAEWAHDRPDVLGIVRHSLARVFSGTPGEASKYTFVARLPLGEEMRVDHLEIANVSKNVVLILNKATLFDSATNFSMPLPHYDLDKWKPVYDEGGALILRNERALPRAWLVAEAEAVDREEALRRIRGQGKAFDPRRTALLELQPGDLPALPGGQISPVASTKISAYESNRAVIETSADMASILVTSEINYPGWIATVDGAPAPIYTADFLLRGIVLPAGSHRVEMRYTAPAARKGALISVFTILMISGLAVYDRRRKN